MELSTKQPSGEFLKPVLKDENKNTEQQSDDELRESQKDFLKDYVKKLNEFEEEKQSDAQDLSTPKPSPTKKKM